MDRYRFHFRPANWAFLETQADGTNESVFAAIIWRHPWQAPTAGILVMAQLNSWRLK
jgi:hypothetical protein